MKNIILKIIYEYMIIFDSKVLLVMVVNDIFFLKKDFFMLML